MEKVVLYSYYRSSCSWRVRIALALKGIAYEYRAVNLVKDGGEQHKPEYRSVNPNGQVPTLLYGGSTITDSVAIMEYLEEAFPVQGERLLPDDLSDRAKVRALVCLITSGIQPIQNLKVLQYAEKHQIDKAEWARHWISSGLDAFEKLLESTAGEFCCGDKVSMADICLIPQLYNAQRFNVDLSKYPNINRIAEKCAQLEAFKVAHAHTQPDCPPELAGKPGP